MTELIRLLFVSDTFILRVSINLCLNQYIIPLAFRAFFDHALKIGAVIVRAGHGAVNITGDDEYAVPFGIFLTYAHLSFDGLLRLVFAGIAKIVYTCFHCSKLL